MKNVKLKIIILGFLIFHSCWMDQSESDPIIGNYVVGWNDMVANRCITFSEDKKQSDQQVLVSNYVFSVGSNDDYIIVKQHPNLPDTTNTKFFIIDIHQKAYKNRGTVIGPMTKFKFSRKVFELQITDIKFDLNYPENPYQN